jgi:hypothetical protein
MTLPSGTISISDYNTETGGAFGSNLNWLASNPVKPAYYVSKNMGSYRGYAYYWKNNDYDNSWNCSWDIWTSNYNCDVTNCAYVPIACGYYQCNACSGIAACANCKCDSQYWLQPNCNCASGNCAYNCTFYQYDCACVCVC